MAEGAAAPGSYTFVDSPSRLPGLIAAATGYHSWGLTPGLHRGLPSPYLTFIFALDEEPIIGGDTPELARSAEAPRATVMLGGLHRAPAYVVQPRQQAGIQLAVHPLAARRLFGTPARALTDLVGDGAAVLGPEAERLRQRMAELPGWPQRFDALWDYLRRRADRAERRPGPSPAVAAAWHRLAASGGTSRVEDVAAHVGYGTRRLNQLFAAEVGLSPKQVGRLVRFDLARRQIATQVRRTGRCDLARVAAERGYFDHPHLVRDFRQFTGTSPTAWIAEEIASVAAAEVPAVPVPAGRADHGTPARALP